MTHHCREEGEKSWALRRSQTHERTRCCEPDGPGEPFARVRVGGMSEISKEPEAVGERVALVASTAELLGEENLAGEADFRGEDDDEGGGSWELLISLQRTVNRFSRRLLRLRAPAAAYLRAKLATSEGTDEVLAKVQERVESEDFLEKLRESRAAMGNDGLPGEVETPPSGDGHFHESFDVNDPTFWEPEAESHDPASSTSHLAGAGKDEDEWEFVEAEDVIESIAAFIAGYVATHPRAVQVSPEQLQRALGKSFGELRLDGKGKARRVWDWGVGVYRGASWTYGTLTAFTNPWIAQMIVAAMYTAGRITCGVGTTAIAAVAGAV